ncbi:MAG: hypothetical protein QM753_14305 [Thermomicrobiales bacterium]
MYVLHMEHPVPDYSSWKAAFDSDPIDRVGSGVVSYRITRPVDDDRYVLIDLDFPTAELAEAALAKLQALWANVTVTGGVTPTTRLLHVAETSPSQ